MRIGISFFIVLIGSVLLLGCASEVDIDNEFEPPEIVFDVFDDKVLWQYEGEDDWHLAYDFSYIIDKEPRELDFKVENNAVRWRYDHEKNWRIAYDLMPLINNLKEEYEKKYQDLLNQTPQDNEDDIVEEALDFFPELKPSNGLLLEADKEVVYSNHYDHWYYGVYITNETKVPLVLEDLRFYYYSFCETYRFNISYDQHELHGFFGGSIINPGETLYLSSGLPVQALYFEDLYLKARSLDGKYYEGVGRVFFSQDEDPYLIKIDKGYNHGPGEPSSFDTLNLRYHADFEVYLTEDIAWVPVNRLGLPTLDYQTIIDNAQDYTWFKENINTVYEVIQYIQYTNYLPSDESNQRVFENGYNWEHHEPAEITIQKHKGNCASMANMFVYALKDVYEEVGYIAWSMPDGSGHIFNYVKEEDYYYVIDLTNYTLASSMAGFEDGEERSYYNADFVSGNLHKVASLEHYAQYFYDAVKEIGNQPPVVFSAYTAHTNAAIDSIYKDGNIMIVYPEALKNTINIIFEDPNQQTFYIFDGNPKMYPGEWSPYYDKWWLD